MHGSEKILDLDAAVMTIFSQGDPERDQGAAERIVALANGYLEQLEGVPVALVARARFRIFLASGLLGPHSKSARWPSVLWDVQYAIEQLNKAILELEGSGDWSLRSMAHTMLARAYFLGVSAAPIHLYEPLAIRHGEMALELVDRKVNILLWAGAAFTLSQIYAFGFTGGRGDRIDKAIELLEEASQGLSGQIGSEFWCDVMHNLGEIYAGRPRGDQKANHARAIECLETVAAIEAKRDPKAWAKAQVSIGGVWLRRGDAAKALQHFEQSQRVYESAAGEHQGGDLKSLYRAMASAYSQVGDRSKQIEYLRRALDRCSQLKRDLDRIRTQAMLAEALKETDAPQAGRLLQECSDGLKEYPAAIRDRVPVMWSLAGLRVEEHQLGRPGALPEAIRLLSEAKDLAWDDPRLAWSACERLGRAYGLADQWPEAADAYMEAVDRLELNYKTMILFQSRGEEFAATVRVRHDAAYAMVRAGRALDAVSMLWSARARLLNEVLMRDHAELEGIAAEHPLAHKAYVEAAERVRMVEVRDRASANDDFVSRSLADEARSASDALNAAIELIRAIPEHSGFLSPPAMVHVPLGRTMVFMVSTSRGSLIITVQDRAESAPVATEYRVDAITILDVMEALGLSRGDAPEKLSSDRLSQALDVLGPSFAAAFTDAIPVSASNVTLVPCGLLGVLPLHLAWIRRDGLQRRLIDECVVDYALTEVPSSEQILTRPVERVVAIGDPGSDLAAADDELEAIRIAYPGATLITRADASVTAVLGLAERAGLLHFACHSSLDPGALYESGLHLADGTLTIGELLAGHPPKLQAARLVVLSSCESAVVDPGSPDQAIGLPAAFVYAGAGAVIASLWPVSDAAAAVLMGNFYSRLRTMDGRIAAGEPARALRESQLWLRKVTASELLQLPSVQSEELRDLLQTFEPEEAPFASARHWAAFIVQGA